MNSLIAFIIIAFIFLIVFRLIYDNDKKQRRTQFIDGYTFPKSLEQKILKKYTHLSLQDAKEVIEGLRDYLHICQIAGKRMVAMPSQVVDLAWHEFILFTKEYEIFCQKGLGRFLHHTPAEAMSSPRIAQDGIKTAWRIACSRENINPQTPIALPTLFALDAKLNIPDGFHYQLHCNPNNKDNYCATHISCSSGCGSCTSHSCSGSSCSSGCGGGD